MLGPGMSSEAIWTAFATMTTAFTRFLKWAFKVSWLRNIDENAGFAVVGTSVVGGTDLVRGVATSAVTNLDLFDYTDETDRIVSISYDRKLSEPLGGTSVGLMTAVLDNSDKRFTPDYNSTIGTAVLPKRPSVAHIGFLVKGQTKLITLFKGLTRQPKERKSDRKLILECEDYMSYLNRYPLDSAKYKGQRSDQIVASILSDIGFGSSQYSLDTGLNTIGFAFFDKGVSAGYRISKICEAEEAVFYVDEGGIMRFENRRKYSQSPYDTIQHTIEPGDILSWETADNYRIINKVVVKAKPRTIRASQDIWQHGVEIVLAASASVTIWADFLDPVDDVTDPAATTDYTAFTETGGGGSDITADISIVMTEFTKAAKLVITNNNAATAYINLLKLRGTPATYIDENGVSSEILEVYEDSDSINKYDEQEYTIENDFIDDADFAQELAQHIVNKYKDPGQSIKLTVQGVPQLQLRDKVEVEQFDLGLR